MKELIDSVEEKLRSNDSKLTPKREQILRILVEYSDKHLSAEEIYNLVKEKAPDVGLATVYRTLDLFQNYEVVHGIDFGDGRKRYEFGAGEGEHNHHHLICTECGKIIEVAEDLLGKLEEKICKQYKFEIENHELKFYGQCESCSNQYRK